MHWRIVTLQLKKRLCFLTEMESGPHLQFSEQPITLELKCNQHLVLGNRKSIQFSIYSPWRALMLIRLIPHVVWTKSSTRNLKAADKLKVIYRYDKCLVSNREWQLLLCVWYATTVTIALKNYHSTTKMYVIQWPHCTVWLAFFCFARVSFTNQRFYSPSESQLSSELSPSSYQANLSLKNNWSFPDDKKSLNTISISCNRIVKSQIWELNMVHKVARHLCLLPAHPDPLLLLHALQLLLHPAK